MKFRSDIQILRGLAVLFVVLYHLGLKNLESGFLGVDIFFVISGFLMAVLYDKSQKHQFFLRRAKRLLPAYYATIAITLIAAAVFTTPNEFIQVVEQVKYSLIFSSNIGFWTQNSYFSTAEFNPLLHLWSLGVEIQFYLMVPALSWLFCRSKFFLPIILIGSLFLCFTFIGISPKTSFFTMPLRLWEFLIGYGAAFYFTQKGDVRHGSLHWVGGVAFVLLLGIPFGEVDGQSFNFLNGHPGLYSLFISIATGLILIFGLPRKVEQSGVGLLLAKIGTYSYSIYLAHFPIIVLFLSSPFAGTVMTPKSFWQLLVVLIMIIVASVFLHQAIERKFKQGSLSKFVLMPSFLVVLLLVFTSTLQLKLFSPEEKRIFDAFSKDRSVYRCGKLVRVLEPSTISCNLTDGLENPVKRLMLVGNSRSDSIKTAFRTAAILNNVELHFLVPNNPLMQGGLSVKRVISEAVDRNIDTVVLHFSPRGIAGEKIEQFATDAMARGIEVAFIEPVPVWEKHIPKAMFENLKHGTDLPRQAAHDYQLSNKILLEATENIKSPNFKKYSVFEYFCSPECKFASEEGTPFYFDEAHLTLTGGSVLNNLFLMIVRES